MQSATITDTQHLPVTAQPTDAAGKPGVLSAGAVGIWTTSDPTVAVVAADPSDPTGNTATISAVAPGTCQITWTDQSAIGTCFQAFTCTVTGGPATGANFVFGPAS